MTDSIPSRRWGNLIVTNPPQSATKTFFWRVTKIGVTDVLKFLDTKYHFTYKYNNLDTDMQELTKRVLTVTFFFNIIMFSNLIFPFL
jgi:hypothetical protein